MILKIHKSSDGKKVLAICDKEIAGKIFENEKMKLDLSSSFYMGNEVSEKDILKEMGTAYIVNLVGEKSVNLGIRAGIVSESNIIKVEGVPHTQVILI